LLHVDRQFVTEPSQCGEYAEARTRPVVPWPLEDVLGTARVKTRAPTLCAHPQGLQSEDDLAGQLHGTCFQNLVRAVRDHVDRRRPARSHNRVEATPDRERCGGWCPTMSWRTLGVLVAALGVGLSGQAWPDVAVALAIAVDEGFVYGTTCDAACGSARELRGSLCRARPRLGGPGGGAVALRRSGGHRPSLDGAQRRTMSGV